MEIFHCRWNKFASHSQSIPCFQLNCSPVEIEIYIFRYWKQRTMLCVCNRKKKVAELACKWVGGFTFVRRKKNILHLISFCLFCFHRDLRCLRNTIHANLFLTYILSALLWIIPLLLGVSDVNQLLFNVSSFFFLLFIFSVLFGLLILMSIWLL